MSLLKSIIASADSYKYSMYLQYPEGTEYVYSYIESRGGPWDEAVFLGLQPFLKEYLSKPITQTDIDLAEALITAHGAPFYREGWEYILKTYHGYLPVIVRSVDEGMIVPVKNVLVTIVNTDPKCYWLTTFLETALLRAVWYPTTVATQSREAKKIILNYLEKTGSDPAQIDGMVSFKLHDFGARGVSSLESAAIGGCAHLVNFMGTDTVSGIIHAMDYYDAPVCGFSIPAMEHSTVTSWGRENETKAFGNMLKQYGKPGSILACVSDSYDIFSACEKWGTELKQQVIDSGATVVIRPDSGEPSEVVVKCLEILDKHFGHTVNGKGFRVLNNVRVIQGDGINLSTIQSILGVMYLAGYAAENVAFGMGGALLQHVNRDTMKFAMKCSAIRVNGEWRDVFKDPITDKGKQSKKGLLKLVNKLDGLTTINADTTNDLDDLLKTRYLDGNLYHMTTFTEVRERAKI